MKKSKSLLFSLILFISFIPSYAADQFLCNYLGQGSDPVLSISLINNGGASWGTYTAGYGNCRSGQGARIPTNPNPEDKWSIWKITDEKGNYYGTVTLNNNPAQNSSPVTLVTYSKEKTNGYSIERLEVNPEPQNPAQWIISVAGKITRPDSDQGPFPTTPIATPAVYKDEKNVPFVLTVKGHNIVDNEGNTITLKGFARPSLEWNEQGQFLSEQDFTNMAQWGANTIRLSINQELWFKSKPISVKGSYKQIIDAMIYHATKKGMVVILDLHWTKEGAGQPNMADKDSVRFWKEIATQYKDFGTVLFELFNEPVNINKSTWLNGNNAYSGYQQLYDAVRSTGAKNICIVNGLEWGFNLNFINSGDGYLYAVKGENIVYGSHPYRRTFAEINASLDGIIYKYPMLFTEFGDNQASDYPNSFAASYKNTLLFLNEYNGNYTAWAWWVSPDNPAFPTLIGDWQKATPINGGIIVKEDMEKNPASSLPITLK